MNIENIRGKCKNRKIKLEVIRMRREKRGENVKKKKKGMKTRREENNRE